MARCKESVEKGIESILNMKLSHFPLIQDSQFSSTRCSTKEVSLFFAFSLVQFFSIVYYFCQGTDISDVCLCPWIRCGLL